MRKLVFFALAALLQQTLFGQDLRIYHGEQSESVFLRRNDRLQNVNRESVTIVRGVDGIVTITVVNPNPFFYKYEIKTEDVDIVDEYSNQFADLVKLITSIPEIADHFKTATGARAPASKFDAYKTALQNLSNEIKTAKDAIKKSDHPETIKEAFDRKTNAQGFGFRAAIESIQKISSDKGHFNSPTLEKDLNDMLQASIDDGSFNAAFNLGAAGTQPDLEALFKQAFQELNNNLATSIGKIIDITKQDRIIRLQVPVKDGKKTTVTLVVTKINASDNVDRELLNEQVAVVLPFYVRKRFEVVPVVNLIFQGNRQKFSVKDGIVASEPDDDAKFNIGAMALMNFASFGEAREYGVGLGIGYSMQPDGSASSFFLIPSLSYKSIVRIGFGFGYNMSPVGLKDGATVGAALPANISNIDNVIDYKRRPAAVFSIAISGLKL